MYESYWKLEQKPFEQSAESRSYYPSETHQGALLKLRYAIESRRGAALLAGPAGAGKTLLLQLLKRQVGEKNTPFAHLVFPQMTVPELLRYMVSELGGDAVTQSSAEESIRRIKTLLSENAERGRHAVLAVDEAHLLEDTRALEAMRMLLNFEVAGRPGLTLLLVGQATLLPIVDRMPGLEERLAVKCLLRHFTLEETISYVNHRLTAAGAKAQIFEQAALETLHELTSGIARRINRLCDLALLIGYAEDRRTITATHLESICEELVTVSPE